MINLKGDVPKQLVDIRAAQESAQRVLDEERGADSDTSDLSDPATIERYFRYYFFDRRNEMDYKVGPEKAERDDTLLNMLAENTLAVNACATKPGVYLRQAFMKAADAFQAINANTRGVIVPYGADGAAVISELCAAWEPKKQFRLLKRAQQFTVNVFPYVFEALQRDHALHEVLEGTGILYLDEKWYNDEAGLNARGREAMGFQDA